MQVFFLAVCLFAVSQAAEEWTAERIEKALAGVPLKNYYDFLPEELKQQIDPTMEKRSASAEGSLHWCCKTKNMIPINEDVSRQTVLYQKVSLQVKTGYEGCGFWGMGRCAHSTARYHQEVRYGAKYMIRPKFNDCPDHHVVCCAGFFLVSGNCVHKDGVIKHTETFETLHHLGLIGGGK